MTDADERTDFQRRCGTLAGLGRAASWAEVGERLRSFTTECAVDRALHLSLRPDPNGRGGLLQVTTLGADDGELVSHGEAVGFDDPLTALCEERQPLRWNKAPADGDPLSDLIARLGEGRRRFQRGIAVPILGPGRARGLFTVTSAASRQEWTEQSRRLSPWLQIFGWEFHRSVSTLLARTDGDGVSVPPREVAVLKSAADGRTALDTARLLGLSVDTVDGYVRDAIRRLGCINKTHAVAVAVRRGLI